MESEKKFVPHDNIILFEDELTPEEKRRFFSKIIISPTESWEGTPCHEWSTSSRVAGGGRQVGDVDRYGNLVKGYGIFRFRGHGVRAHRLALYIAYGLNPAPVVDHLCHNTLCCNPLHLRNSTIKENSANSWPVIHPLCSHGHVRTFENTYFDPRGKRQCRDCQKVWEKDKYPKKYAREKSRQTHTSEMRDFCAEPKLNWDIVREIRRRYETDPAWRSQRKLAREFRVSQPMIGFIVRYESWKEEGLDGCRITQTGDEA